MDRKWYQDGSLVILNSKSATRPYHFPLTHLISWIWTRVIRFVFFFLAMNKQSKTLESICVSMFTMTSGWITIRGSCHIRSTTCHRLLHEWMHYKLCFYRKHIDSSTIFHRYHRPINLKATLPSKLFTSYCRLRFSPQQSVGFQGRSYISSHIYQIIYYIS